MDHIAGGARKVFFPFIRISSRVGSPGKISDWSPRCPPASGGKTTSPHQAVDEMPLRPANNGNHTVNWRLSLPASRLGSLKGAEINGSLSLPHAHEIHLEWSAIRSRIFGFWPRLHCSIVSRYFLLSGIFAECARTSIQLTQPTPFTLFSMP